MIALTRTACPDCLKEAPSIGDRYSRAEVVQALWQMQHGKCCYSETRLCDHGHGKNVEHFRPKDRFDWLRNDWDNLLLVCPHCNGRKSNKFPTMICTDEDTLGVVVDIAAPETGSPVIIDPCNENPEVHLTYELDDAHELYGQILPRNNSGKGEETIRVTGIDDDVFFRERFEQLNDVLEVEYRNLLRHRKRCNEEAQAASLHTFETYVSDDARYAALAREFARTKHLDTRFKLDIPGR